MKNLDWKVIALIALFACLGAVLVAAGHPDEGKMFLALTSGVVMGLPLSVRRTGHTDPPPPPPPVGLVIAGIVALSIALSGCSSTPGEARSPTLCAVLRTTRAVCENVQSAEVRACEPNPEENAP